MYLHKKIFIPKELSKKKESLIAAIKNNKFTFNIHVITISPGNHQLEMFPIGLNVQPAFDVNKHIVVGITGTHYQGLELLEKISQRVYDTQGDLDFKAYFEIR